MLYAFRIADKEGAKRQQSELDDQLFIGFVGVNLEGVVAESAKHRGEFQAIRQRNGSGRDRRRRHVGR